MVQMFRRADTAELLDYATGLKEYTGIISERDAILVFSISGGAQNGSPVQELQYFDRPDGPKIVLFTMTSHSPAEKYADVTVLLPCVSRMAPDVFIDDAPVFYMAIELLLEAMAGR